MMIAVISRTQPVKGADGFTRTQPSPVYSGIICALSSGSDSSRQTDAQQNLRYTASCLSSRTRKSVPAIR
ncbi:MAG: hypothetical protein V8Q30_07450 [Acutalibacteraceae bacterium]